MQSRMRTAALTIGLAAIVFAGEHFAAAQDLKGFEQRITTKVLPNGLMWMPAT